MCVMNGKLSEGIDFKDDLARLIFVVGIPFASTKAAKIINKRSYLDKFST